MVLLNRWKQQWLSNPRKDILSGMTVAIALIPEAIAFSLLAGVDPMVGLYASFVIAVTISFTGGRPGMISAATGAMASLMGPIIVKYGIEYLYAASILTGVLQILMGVLKLGRVIAFIPHPVMTGFVNALAIIIFMAQVPHLQEVSGAMVGLLAATLLIVYGLPLLTKAIPSALVAIVVITVAAIAFRLDVYTVGDMGPITQALPLFHWPDISFNWQALWAIFPYSLALAIVGMTETLMTAAIVDEMTETGSDKNKEMRGQGIANMLAGCFGGMAGCAMIGQTVINVKSGGRTRLSSFVAGITLLLLILVAGEWVQQIPMAALVGVMVMVSISTFDWSSVVRIRKTPFSDAFVMLVTVVAVVATSNLAIGVMAGIVLSALIFGWRSSKIEARSETAADGGKRYTVKGQLFFGTMTGFADLFDYRGDPQKVVIDFSRSHIWDQSAVIAIAKAVLRYKRAGKQVVLAGLNEESRRLLEKADFPVTIGA